jgi:hypothetical protein
MRRLRNSKSPRFVRSAARDSALLPLVVRATLVSATLVVGAFAPAAHGAGAAATALYLDRTVAIEHTLDDPTDLWVTPADLGEVNGFELKPEGACLAELCIPVDQGPGSEIVTRRGEETWFSLTGFARKIGQSFVADHERRVWSFAPVPATRSSFVDQGYAPDFALTDRQGKTVRLSDFRGKKVLVVTWASW